MSPGPKTIGARTMTYGAGQCAATISSWASLLLPYREIGSAGVSSRSGSSSRLGPAAASEDSRTTLRSFLSGRSFSISARVPSRLTRVNSPGETALVTAARWKTSSVSSGKGADDSKSPGRAATVPAKAQAASLALSRTRTVTWFPPAASSSPIKWPPTNPVPPVTSIFMEPFYKIHWPYANEE